MTAAGVSQNGPVELVVGSWAEAGPAATLLRHTVFTKEQGIDAALDQDGRDEGAWHVVARSGDHQVVLGTGRLLIEETHGRIGRMAVLAEARNGGLGAQMLALLCQKADELGLEDVVLHAQRAAVRFYERNGFHAEGPVFLEAGIEHQQMRRSNPNRASIDDEHLWLEEIDGPAAMQWVTDANAISTRVLRSDPLFETVAARLTSIFESDQRIPMATVRGRWLYNYWQDARQVRGIWRRTTLDSYRSAQPDWEVLLDVDLLAEQEGESWVWAGAQVLYPQYRRALVRLSKGGGDATVTREFDLVDLRFIDDGFVLPHGKSQVSWIDEDSIFVCADSGAGSMTSSGYPRTARRWRRGTALADAVLEFTGEESDVLVNAFTSRDWCGDRLIEYEWIHRSVTFSTSKTYLRVGATWLALDLPDDAEVGTFAKQLLVTLKTDWTVSGGTWPQGALLAIGLDDFLAGSRNFEALFLPEPRCVLAGMTNTKDRLVITQMNDLVQEARSFTHSQEGWQGEPVALQKGVMSELFAFDADASNDLWIAQSGPLFPTRLGLWQEGETGPTFLKSLPGLFDATGLAVERFDAVSKDGTRVPYVVVQKEGAQASAPTLLSGYGGFEVSRLPVPYSAAVGAAWLEDGGRYVVAGIRGGGEFGPAWHLDAIREKKQNCFDDFISVARDLIERGLASARPLGVQGGSNGGLLVGAVMTQAPELFGAIVCQVPLLDMRRYTKLLAGASWMAEYGDPDVEADWSFISAYSPYQNLKSDAAYPPMLLATSTRDDRVHPGHARKMAARMQAMGHQVLYYENIEGGHAGAANQKQAAELSALAFTFLWQTLR